LQTSSSMWSLHHDTNQHIFIHYLLRRKQIFCGKQHCVFIRFRIQGCLQNKSYTFFALGVFTARMQAEIESGVSMKLVSLFESCPQQGHSSGTSSIIYHFFPSPYNCHSMGSPKNPLFSPYRQNTRNDLQNRSNLAKLGGGGMLFFLYSTRSGGTAVKVLCCKSEGRWFYPRWCHWNFTLT